MYIASPGKDQNSKFEVQFLLNAYCFLSFIKSKNHKTNHCKSGTTCTIEGDNAHFLNLIDQRIMFFENSVIELC